MNDFVMRCFVKDPAMRPSAAELLEHALFRDDTSQSKKPSYRELKKTLRTLHRPARKKASGVDWNPVTVPVVSEEKSPLRTSLSQSMTRSVAQESALKVLQDALQQEKDMREDREETIQQLVQENEGLTKKLREMSRQTRATLSPEEFYKDYLITIAMSVKVINHNRGKECRFDMKELLDKAKEDKVAIHELIEWIPKQIAIQKKIYPKSHIF
jgi:serine/threonine protein kinase